jgi:hypothetical protein
MWMDILHGDAIMMYIHTQMVHRVLDDDVGVEVGIKGIQCGGRIHKPIESRHNDWHYKEVCQLI